MSENIIEFNNISKFFGKVIALKDVTMKLKKVRSCVYLETMVLENLH